MPDDDRSHRAQLPTLPEKDTEPPTSAAHEAPEPTNAELMAMLVAMHKQMATKADVKALMNTLRDTSGQTLRHLEHANREGAKMRAIAGAVREAGHIMVRGADDALHAGSNGNGGGE